MSSASSPEGQPAYDPSVAVAFDIGFGADRVAPGEVLDIDIETLAAALYAGGLTPQECQSNPTFIRAENPRFRGAAGGTASRHPEHQYKPAIELYTGQKDH